MIVAASNSRKWTMAHAHLLGMGGITTVDPSFEKDNSEDPRGEVLSFDRYKRLAAENTTFELPKITSADIKDRSKGDFLSKLIAILQTTWFILQCIARSREQLALTELELVTLALASLNAVTYAFWWHKPLGIQEPVRIYFKTDAMAEEHRSVMSDGTPKISARNLISKVGEGIRGEATGIFNTLMDPCNEGVFMAVFSLFFALPLSVLLTSILCLLLPFPLGIIFLLKILQTKPVTEGPSDGRGLIAARVLLSLRKFRYRLTSYIARVSEGWLLELLDGRDQFSFSAFNLLLLFPALFFLLLTITILLLPFFILLFFISLIFTAAFGIITSNTVAPGAAHVPAFYAPRTKSDRYSRMVVFSFFGVIFGGLHCIGWDFTYPTSFEQHLWRATSLAITAIPLVVAPIDYILDNFELNSRFAKVVRHVLDLVMTILLFIYVPARLSLIAQALALLRNQPQTAFIAVDWAQYIPHFF